MRNDIPQLIESSFLKKEQKEILLDKFNKEGESDAFFEELDIFLKGDIEQRNKRYSEFEKNIDGKMAETQSVFDKKKEELEKKLREQLLGLEAAEFEKKNTIWEEYYSSLEKLRQEQEGDTKSWIGKLIMKLAK